MRTLLFSVIAFLPLGLLAQASHVFIDGYTSDWTACTNKYTDEAGDGNTIDLLQLRVMNDENYLYLAFRTYEEFQLSQDNSLTLLIDTDGDASTGFQFNGIGAELKWDFGRRRGNFYYSGGSTSVRHDDFGFLALPTVTAKEFELALSRNAKPDGTHALFTSDSVRIVIYDNQQPGDILPEAGSFFTYHFDNSQLPAVQPVTIDRDNSNYLRLMTWNMLQDGIADPTRSESFERVIKAVSPDVITFNEAWDTEASAVKNILNNILPLAGGASWQAHKLVDGNITASRYPIKQSYDVVPGKRISAHLIDLPDAKYSHDIVVFNCHLKCCNADGDNETRQYEVNGLMNFVNKMKAGYSVFPVEANTPFVFMGDMNLVGTSENLATMLTGIDGQKPDWDNGNLEDDVARNATINAAYTYSESGSSYWPGRLDYVIYSGSEMKLQKSFIFQSALMSEEELTQLGVYRTDNANASDHLPHIADFTIEKTSGINPIGEASKIKIYPQPVVDFLTIEGIGENPYKRYEVFNLLGIEQIDARIEQNASSINIDIRNLKNGIYFVTLFSESGKNTFRIVVSH